MIEEWSEIQNATCLSKANLIFDETVDNKEHAD